MKARPAVEDVGGASQVHAPPTARDLGSFRRRLVLLTAGLATLAALSLIGVVAVVLEQGSASAVQIVLRDRAEAVISSADQSTSGTVPQVPDSRLDPGVAVYDDRGSLVAGQPAPSLREAFARLSTSERLSTIESDESYRVLADPFTTVGGARGVVVLAEPLAPYDRNVSTALGVSVVAGLLIVVMATLLAGWTSRRALAPVAAMAATAEQWSERDLERRFALGPPTDEIRALGHTLDALLDKVAGAILAEQRLTSELAHELRSPLTAIQSIAELASTRTDLDTELREDVEDVLASCREMGSTITGLLDLARATAAPERESSCRLLAVLEAVRRDLGATEQVSLEVPAQLVVSASSAVAGRAVGPVLANATALAEHVRVAARVEGHTIVVRISDDGPGIDPSLANDLFEPGRSGHGGSGLGLALARRVARSVGGDVLVRPSAPGRGAVFEVSLPLGQETTDEPPRGLPPVTTRS